NALWPRFSSMPDAELQIGLGSAALGEAIPNVAKAGAERVDVAVAVQRRRRQPQPLRAARHGRIIDRLNSDPVALPQLVAGGFAEAGVGVADHDRDDVAC